MLVPEIIAGGGLGVLVGLLISLSVSPVVGGFVSALTVLLGAFFGLTPSSGPDRAWRIGSFGLACAAGVVIGLALRTSDRFTPSLEHQASEWQKAGATQSQAVAYVAFERLGIKPAGAELSAAPKPGASSSVLFASRTDVCGRLGDVSAPAAELRILREAKAPFDAIAAGAEAVPQQTGAVLAAAVKSLCGF